MQEKRIKLLKLTNKIPHYNLPAYNLIGDKYDFTIAHWGDYVPDEETNFKQIILTPQIFKSFVFFKENISKLAKKYDAVIALGDLHVIPYWLLGFKMFRKYSYTFWGIGVSASYDKKFDADRKLDKIRFFVMNKADSLVFYSSYPINRYVEDGGVDIKKLFVAINTVEVKTRIKIELEKKYFLFVGTLYKEKKIFDLLEAYLLSYNKNNQIQDLVIVGDGSEKESIESWIEKNQLDDKITLLGAIYDTNKLMNIFKYAIACVSPGQAGLSVLTSMAYGVPFVTTLDAITGGEIFNIQNGINGILYEESVENLSKVLNHIHNNPNIVKNMSCAAQDYYFKNCTMFHMVDGVNNAVEYALNQRKKQRK
jgi:glycosyltransferase involved in cell wall biosynthesis